MATLGALLFLPICRVVWQKALRTIIQWLLRIHKILISWKRSIGQGDGIAEVAYIHSDVEVVPWELPIANGAGFVFFQHVTGNEKLKNPAFLNLL